MSIENRASEPTTARAPALFYESARQGMLDLFAQPAVWSRPTRTVLLPAFIGWSPHEGSGVFDPVAELGLTARFYGLAADLSIDLSSLEQQLSNGDVDVLVVIHYFGRIQPDLEHVRLLADRHGVLLVEDLAHGFFTAVLGGPAGRTGAVAAYSLHKMFATPGAMGGMLVYRDPRLISGQRETAPQLARYILDYDWSEIAMARRRRFGQLTAMLADLPEQGKVFRLLWPELRPDESPQTLPVRIAGPGRDVVYRRMNAEGYGMVSLYHTLIAPVTADPTLNGVTELSREIINFPVHQDVDVDQYAGLVRSFVQALHHRNR